MVSLDWKGLFIYPEQNVASLNELVIPAGRPVHLSLTSDTVMLSFLVPQLAGQIYTMAGMRTELDLQADHPGRYLGENTQYNGAGFQDHKFTVTATTADGFDGWVAQARRQGAVLDQARYAAIAQPSVPAAPESFAAVEPDLFYHVIGRTCPPCAARLRADDAAEDRSRDEKAHHD